jgi:hypothetical protein
MVPSKKKICQFPVQSVADVSLFLLHVVTNIRLGETEAVLHTLNTFLCISLNFNNYVLSFPPSYMFIVYRFFFIIIPHFAVVVHMNRWDLSQ